MTDINANVPQGETQGPEQEPTQAGDQDPAVRDPRPGGPMVQPVDQEEANDALAQSPDAVYGQREGQPNLEPDAER